MTQVVAQFANPLLPFVKAIPGGLQPGKQVFVQGTIPISTDGFAVNFKCNNGDIAFHFNPRISSNCVVRNTCRSGRWEQEERHGGQPFFKERQFEVIFLVQDSHFKVAVDGKHFCEYQHRMSLHTMQNLEIGSGIVVHLVRFDAPYSYSPMPSMPSPMSYPSSVPAPIFNPPVPFTGIIPPNGLHAGKIIFISGVPRGVNRFSINLQSGPSDHDDVALHFDVRFDFGHCVNEIIRNHKQNGVWGTEERQKPYFPFRPQTNFDMMILCEANCFKVALNNQHFIEFQHRMHPVTRFTYLTISGDIHLTQIRFQ